MSHYYNPNIPLETALEMFDDEHVRFEIIEDYHAEYRRRITRLVADLALGPGEAAADGHITFGVEP